MRQIQQSLEIHSTVMRTAGNSAEGMVESLFLSFNHWQFIHLQRATPGVTTGRDSGADAPLDRDVQLSTYILAYCRQY
jgi:hypothetical protein